MFVKREKSWFWMRKAGAAGQAAKFRQKKVATGSEQAGYACCVVVGVRGAVVCGVRVWRDGLQRVCASPRESEWQFSASIEGVSAEIGSILRLRRGER